MKTKIQEVVAVDLQLLKSNPPVLVIKADGKTSSAGWTNGELEPVVYVQFPPDGIWDFSFVAEPPTGPSGTVVSEIRARYPWIDPPDKLKGVRIHAANNKMEQLINPNSENKFSGGGEGFPRGLFYDEELTQNISANALLNLKQKPANLYVHGSIITYRDDDKVTLSKASPQGFNPNILILNLEIVEGVNPKKGTAKKFFYDDSNEVSKIKQVTILYGLGSSLTIDVKIFG